MFKESSRKDKKSVVNCSDDTLNLPTLKLTYEKPVIYYLIRINCKKVIVNDKI